MKIRTYAALPCAVLLAALTTASDGGSGCNIQQAADGTSSESLESATYKVAPTKKVDLSSNQLLKLSIEDLKTSGEIVSSKDVYIDEFSITDSSGKDVSVDIRKLYDSNRNLIGLKNITFGKVGIYNINLSLVNAYGVKAEMKVIAFQNEASVASSGSSGSKKWTYSLDGSGEFKIFIQDLIDAKVVSEKSLTGKERFMDFKAADGDMMCEPGINKVQGAYLYCYYKEGSKMGTISFGLKESPKDYKIYFGSGRESSWTYTLDGSGEFKLFIQDMIDANVISRPGEKDQFLSFKAADGDMNCEAKFEKESYMFCTYKEGSSAGTISFGQKGASKDYKINFSSGKLEAVKREASMMESKESEVVMMIKR